MLCADGDDPRSDGLLLLIRQKTENKETGLGLRAQWADWPLEGRDVIPLCRGGQAEHSTDPGQSADTPRLTTFLALKKYIFKANIVPFLSLYKRRYFLSRQQNINSEYIL